MSKTTKIVGAVLLLAIAGYVAMKSVGGGPDAGLPKELTFVCVATGEMFDMNIDDVLSIPAKNPNTGEWTLLPCKPDSSGVYRVLDFYRTPLTEELKDVNQYVDAASLEVKPRN